MMFRPPAITCQPASTSADIPGPPGHGGRVASEGRRASVTGRDEGGVGMLPPLAGPLTPGTEAFHLDRPVFPANQSLRGAPDPPTPAVVQRLRQSLSSAAPRTWIARG